MELFLQELKYHMGDNPSLWVEQMKHVQEVYGYNDREMILLMETLIPKPIAVWMLKIGPSNIEEVFAVFFQLHELGVHTEQDLKLALLHTSCIGSNNLKNVVGGGKSKETSSSAEAEVEVTVTDNDELQRFPEFSFTINCGFGDICINDVLKLDQMNIYTKISSKGKMGKACKQTIVGRVVYKSEILICGKVRNGASLRCTGAEESDQCTHRFSSSVNIAWSF
ncbi:uncharacterized protein [Physcomitrium patens]|uniref:uncharacterized protein isoform X2 n=1 Tax=Physcomitrium patens TaxID=3218 RepID=UPI000D157EAE|nr:uncharacterized protein LOC112293996 isoform X2 [Physcomitrium patens]|eukprot:XP_024399833.1 uncharacterized protein LOC112293996 isoform X2 [Physcomitrella patens]